MLSRSSSAYQPLEKAAADEEAAIRAAGGGGAANQVEMTSIAVISNHPLGSTASTTTVPVHGNQGRGGKARDHSEFTVCKSEDKTPWTNFHFVMCIGIVGFFIFWIFLLSKMYLPPEFQIWSLLGLSGSDDGEDGPVSNSTSSVTEEMVFSEEDMSVTVDSVT